MRTIRLVFLLTLLLYSFLLQGQSSPQRLASPIDDFDIFHTAIQEMESLYEPHLRYDFQINVNHLLDSIIQVEPYSNSQRTFIAQYGDYINTLESRQGISTVALNQHRYQISQLYKALKQYDQQHQMLQSIIQSNSPKNIHHCLAYSDLASYAVRIEGDPYSALQYLNTAFADPILMQEVEHELRIRLQYIYVYAKIDESTIGNTKTDIMDIIRSHRQHIVLSFDQSNIHPNRLSAMYNNIGLYHESLGNYDIALSMYQNAFDHYVLQNDSIKMFKALNNIGMYAGGIQDYDLLKKCFERIYRESPDLEQRTTAYANIAYYLFEDDPIKKLAYYYEAISLLAGKSWKGVESFELPSLEEILGSGETTTFEIYLKDLSNDYLKIYRRTRNKDYLSKALETLKLIEDIYDVLRYNSAHEKTKLYWIESGVEIHNQAVQISYELNNVESAFRNMEKNKALLLQENMKTFQSRLKQNIPRNILEKEYQMYYELASCTQALQENPEDSSIKTKFHQLQSRYQSLMDSLKMVFPNYVKTISMTCPN